MTLAGSAQSNRSALFLIFQIIHPFLYDHLLLTVSFFPLFVQFFLPKISRITFDLLGTTGGLRALLTRTLLSPHHRLLVSGDAASSPTYDTPDPYGHSCYAGLPSEPTK